MGPRGQPRPSPRTDGFTAEAQRRREAKEGKSAPAKVPEDASFLGWCAEAAESAEVAEGAEEDISSLALRRGTPVRGPLCGEQSFHRPGWGGPKAGTWPGT